MYRRKLFTAVILLSSICLSSPVYSAKSVYVISSQDHSIVKPYLINANHVTLKS
jgi:hypothetical protein